MTLTMVVRDKITQRRNYCGSTKVKALKCLKFQSPSSIMIIMAKDVVDGRTKLTSCVVTSATCVMQYSHHFYCSRL